MMMPAIEEDKDILAELDAAWRQYKGIDEGTDTEPEAEAEAAPTLDTSTLVHPDWPAWEWFSKVFGTVPKNVPDIPVPQFTPDYWPEQARAMIPSLPPFWVHDRDTMYSVALAVLNGDTTLLTGPTGSGKTSSLAAFCAECVIPLWVTSCYGRMEHTDFLGSSSLRADAETGANVTEYNPTQLINSMRYGGMSCIDEAFRSPTLMAIQSILEARHSIVLADADGLSESERVIVAPEGKWWVMLTDNTTGTGDHTGNYNAEVQDLSTLDRITSTIYVDYNKPGVEKRIVLKAAPSLPDKMAKDMVSVANLVRDAFKQQKIMQTMSMRALLSWAQKTVVTNNPEYAFKQSFLCKLDPVSAGVTAECYHQVFGKTP